MQQPSPRSRIIVGLFSLGLLVGVALMTSPASAQTTSVGPYYATPSWDQTLPAATRFIVLSNFAGEAVLDRETGLVWEKSPQATFHPWDSSAGFNASAIAQCTSRTTGGRKGWRLPSVHELASLVDPNNPDGNPDLPPGHPFTNVQLSGYWSATTRAETPTNAWFVVFGNGFVNSSGSGKSGSGHVWCVRGGGLLSEY